MKVFEMLTEPPKIPVWTGKSRIVSGFSEIDDKPLPVKELPTLIISRELKKCKTVGAEFYKARKSNKGYLIPRFLSKRKHPLYGVYARTSYGTKLMQYAFSKAELEAYVIEFNSIHKDIYGYEVIIKLINLEWIFLFAERNGLRVEVRFMQHGRRKRDYAYAGTDLVEAIKKRDNYLASHDPSFNRLRTQFKIFCHENITKQSDVGVALLPYGAWRAQGKFNKKRTHLYQGPSKDDALKARAKWVAETYERYKYLLD